MVKYTKPESNLLQRRMLHLKYGTDCPDKTTKPPSIVAMSAVAEILGEPLETLNWLHRKYFNKQQPTRH